MSSSARPAYPIGLPPPLPRTSRPPASAPSTVERPRKRQRRDEPSLPNDTTDAPSSDNEGSSSSTSSESQASGTSSSKRKRRRNLRTLFAALAGRSTTRRADTTILSTHDSSTGAPLTPWESLALTSHRAPERYEEPELDCYGFERWLPEKATWREDVYKDGANIDELRRGWLRAYEREIARRNGDTINDEDEGGEEAEESFLKPRESIEAQKERRAGLPSSDMCAAVLRYTSYYYAALHTPDPSTAANMSSSKARKRTDSKYKIHSPPNLDLHSLDETALLAMAILMEESARAIVSPKQTVEGTETGGEGWRALMVGLKSERDEDALDVVDRPEKGPIAGGQRMKRDRRDQSLKWARRKAKMRGERGDEEDEKIAKDGEEPDNEEVTDSEEQHSDRSSESSQEVASSSGSNQSSSDEVDEGEADDAEEDIEEDQLQDTQSSGSS